jgi:hypothetical protein
MGAIKGGSLHMQQVDANRVEGGRWRQSQSCHLSLGCMHQADPELRLACMLDSVPRTNRVSSRREETGAHGVLRAVALLGC